MTTPINSHELVFLLFYDGRLQLFILFLKGTALLVEDMLMTIEKQKGSHLSV